MWKFLKDNVMWNVNKKYYTALLGNGSSIEQLWADARSMAVSARHSTRQAVVNVNDVIFATNAISMADKCCRHEQLDVLWQSYSNMAHYLGKRLKGVLLPVYDEVVRIEALVTLYMVATQMHEDAQLWVQYKLLLSQSANLTDRELAYIDDVLLLCRCQYYCAVCRHYATTTSMQYFDRLHNSKCPLGGAMVHNSCYSNADYSDGISTVVDCFGASSVMLCGEKMDSSMSINIYANKRNVMDTFCQHLYGDNMAMYCSQTNSIHATMLYQLRHTSEIRNVQIVAGVRSSQRYTVRVGCVVEGGKGLTLQNFVLNNCSCVAVSGDKNYYVAYAMVRDNVVVDAQMSTAVTDTLVDITLEHSVVLGCGQRSTVNIVSIYGSSIAEISQQIDLLNNIGYCERMSLQCSIVNGNQYNIATHITASSNMYTACDSSRVDKVHNYIYQFGDSSISTLLDNQGNSATLIDGFAFGGAESLYYYTGNKISRIDCGKFAINADGYSHSQCIGNSNVAVYIAHRHAKHYTISSNGTGGVLMIMPLEQLSTVTQLDNAFDITSKGRHFVLTYTGKLQCFTTNSIECNSHRLRRRLSNDCSAGNCLVLNFAKCNTLEIEITNCNKLPIGKAVVKESLLSTYLNYMNNKNIYLTVNKLRAVNALTLSAMVYTNSNYVWQYLQQMEAQDACYSGSSYYYDTNRHMVSCQDDMTYALALLYYATVTGNVSVLTPERIGTIQNILYSYHGDGVQLCVVALALKKLSRLNIDKVRALVEYTAVKKLIMSNKNLYAYAQAIGALPMVNASKQRLKSLVNIHNIPRCFYYVSQLENIYGIELIGNKLRVRPSTDDTTSLEQLLLRVGDKSISTIFDKGDNYSLLLNGLQCYSGVDVAQLPADNTLLVSC